MSLNGCVFVYELSGYGFESRCCHLNSSVFIDTLNMILFVRHRIVNTFHVNGLFLYPMKTSENQLFSVVFWGYRKISDIKWANYSFFIDTELTFLKSLVLEHTSYCLLSKKTLREKCPYLELFWSVFCRIRTEYGEMFHISPYSVRTRENTDQNNSEYGHFCAVREMEKISRTASVSNIRHSI